MKAKLIINPASGSESAIGHLPMLNARLRERTGSLDIVITTGDGDAAEAGRHAVLDGYDHLFVAGGDGTVNEVLNGVGGVAGGLAAVTFAVIPLGTGNDFATALGLADEPEAAVRQLLDGEAAAIDVGLVNARHFVNVSAGGFMGEVSDAVNPRLKSLLGKLAYLVGGAQALIDYDPVHTLVRDGQADTALALHAFAVCNSRLVGGGRLIAPDAIVNDGWLDACLIHAMPTLDFVALLRRVSAGEHVHDDRVSYFRTQSLELAFARAIKINTDGEVLETDRCRYQVLPGAARMLMPRRHETADSNVAERGDDGHRTKH
jgi:diacylglycerol kinase (ATP)